MELRPHEQQHFHDTALRVREHIIRMCGDGGCFIGASMSCVEILCYLYLHLVDNDAILHKRPTRDYVLLSKGHDVPALYALFSEIGLLETSRLANHLKLSDDIYWHPNARIPGVEFHSGSLGHLLSVGMGIALDVQRTGASNRVFVILGDGELNEGSIWEGCLVAAARKLTNLYLIVDRNQFQANLPTEELNPLEPLAAKFEAFGLRTLRCNGHDLSSLNSNFQELVSQEGPSVLIADTVRGKGLPSIEARADRWFCNFSAQEREQLLLELHGHIHAQLSSVPLTVR